MSGIKAKTVAKYVVLPGFIPRLKAFFGSGFGYIAFLMAQVYAMVRLLPADHPYLNPQNAGRFGIRHVIAESANSLKLSKNNIDQLIVFVLMLTGVVLLGIQLLALIFNLVIAPAMALPFAEGPSIFITPNTTFDIAYILLDQVFGIGPIAGTPFFNSCVAQNVSCDPLGFAAAPGPFPWPFHQALHTLFEFYSLGILVVGVIIFLYFLVVVVVETATTGTPFGQRFQNVWVPIRLVMAVGLLVPLNYGYNSGQYITFAAAKFGSGLATNGWIRYNNTIHSAITGPGNPLGERENLIARPKPPDGAVIAEMMSIIHTCAFAHYWHDSKISKGQAAQPPGTNLRMDLPETAAPANRYLANAATQDRVIRPYLVKTPPAWQAAVNANPRLALLPTTTYDAAVNFYTSGDIIIRFGKPEDPSDPDSKILPICGEVHIPISDRNLPSGDPARGAVETQLFFFELIRDLWGNFPDSETLIDFSGRYVLKLNKDDPCVIGCTNGNLENGGCGTAKPASENRLCALDNFAADWRQATIDTIQAEINTTLDTVWTGYNANITRLDMDANVMQRGWGGAGLFFNRMAEMNGPFIAAWMDVPRLQRYPEIMEKVREARASLEDDVTEAADLFNPNTNDGQPIAVDLGPAQENGKQIALALHAVFKYWHEDDVNLANAEKINKTNTLEMGMNLIFGTYGLFSMNRENAHIHPLAQLIALGKGLVESTIRNVAGSTLTAAMGGFMGVFSKAASSGATALSGFLSTTAFVGLTAGLVLFYVLPFLPFVYFYFAVASWIKTIFEAMVGVPLWALAHLRLDGDGLPGDSAANGYFLIFEIFVRPVLTVFGLVAAMIIFTAQVRVLNFMWLLVIENIGGHSDTNIGIAGTLTFERDIVDQFFYTVVYAIIVYMLATSSFKLIDKIPDNILRWMGQGVSSFGDINDDPTQSLTKYAALGGLTAGQRAVGGITELSGGLGKLASPPPPGSDIRLKENIEHLGFENGMPVYLFNYIGEDQRYKGVMAQDILKIKPEAVVRGEDGFMAVYYDQLGVEMELYDELKHRKDFYDA